jgi:hypothetical protein
MSEMPHKYEVWIKEYLLKLSSGECPPIDDALIDQACEDFKHVLKKQLSRENREFTMRMSNVGRPTCQLWWQKNHPEKATAPDYSFVMKMLLGDTIEVLSLLLMRSAGIPVESYHGKVTLSLADDAEINGEYDIVIDDKVWDIKSASPFAYEHKFKDFESVQSDDSFGYVAQGFGYARAAGKEFGGWIVINKSTGEWRFVEADTSYEDEYQRVINDSYQYITTDKEFARCFDDIEETYRGTPTGNRYIAKDCMYCDYKFSCWPTLQYRRQESSKAKNKPWRYYTVYGTDQEKEKDQT